jgi:uncharacterized protein YuzE
MAVANYADYAKLLPLVRQAPEAKLNTYYDAEGDVLYVSFGEPREADDSELTDDDVILRYVGGDVVGVSILHASKR